MPSNKTSGYTKRLQLTITINQEESTTTFRIPEVLTNTEIDTLITSYADCLTDIHTMTALVPTTRQSAVDVVGAAIAERGSDLFVPYPITPIQCSAGIGTPTVNDILSLSTITGRCSTGKKWITFIPGIAMDIGAGTLSDTYGDMKITPTEVPSLQTWFDEYWGTTGSVRALLVGPDNSPLLFVRPRLLVRYSARKTNTLRKR